MPNVRNIVSVTFALESLRTNRENEEWREKDRIVEMWMTQFSAERTESDTWFQFGTRAIAQTATKTDLANKISYSLTMSSSR